MICPKCGAFIRNDSRFCNYCGEKLNITNRRPDIPVDLKRPREERFDIEAPPAPEKPKGPEDYRQNPWVAAAIILSGIAIAGVAVILFYVLKNNQPLVVNPVATSVQEDTAGSRDAEPSTEETPEPSTEAETPEVTEPPETAPPSTEAPSESAPPRDPYLEDLEVGGIIYRIYDTYAVLLKCYSGDRVIELPAMIRTSAGAEVPLTIFADTAFDTCDHLQYLKVPEGVTTILFRTFLNCRNLREVVLPDTLFSIQGNTFENTPGVTVISHAGTYAHQAAMNLGIPWREGSELSAVIE